MGGPGSGSGYRSSGKTTVENSLVIAVGTFRGRLFDGATGSLVWNWADGHSASIGYAVSCAADLTTVTLQYRWADEDVRIPVRIQTTPAQFGGRRPWFTCPLVVSGRACNRRIGKLYCPPGVRYFGCRTCHGLTYRSCRESHRSERIILRACGLLGYDAETSRQIAKALG